MKRFVPSILLSVCAFGIAAAQSRTPFEASRQQAADALIREWSFGELTNQSGQQASEEAKRRDAEFRERSFVEKANKFIHHWKRFATKYNEKGVFDVKAAREVSKAFRELENGGDWPNPK
jgi:hypothetical protein